MKSRTERPAEKPLPELLLGWVRQPGNFKVVCIGVLVSLGMLVVYLPLSVELEALRGRLRDERERLDLVRAIEKQRELRASYAGRLPRNSDENWWARHIVGGVRDNGVKLHSLAPGRLTELDCDSLRGLGFKMVVSGSFERVAAFVAWLEATDPFVRVTQASFEEVSGEISARLSVAALIDEGGIL